MESDKKKIQITYANDAYIYDLETNKTMNGVKQKKTHRAQKEKGLRVKDYFGFNSSLTKNTATTTTAEM